MLPILFPVFALSECLILLSAWYLHNHTWVIIDIWISIRKYNKNNLKTLKKIEFCETSAIMLGWYLFYVIGQARQPLISWYPAMQISFYNSFYDDVIKWKHFPRYWPFVRRIHRSRVNSPLKGQWRGALMFSLISFWIKVWVNNGEAGDLRRYRAHYDDTVMSGVLRQNQVSRSGQIITSNRYCGM